MEKMSDFEKLLSSDKKESELFCKWFWNGDNSKKLIENLNKKSLDLEQPSGGKKFIRLENEDSRPYVYGIVFDQSSISLSQSGDGTTTLNMDEWRFVKIGKTRKADRTNTIIKKLEVNYDYIENVAKCIFRILMDPNDARGETKTEKDVRESFGIPVDKKLTPMLKFPVKSEWVITTQKHIEKVLKKIITEGEEVTSAVMLDPVNKFPLEEDKKNLPTGLELTKGMVSLAGETPVSQTETIERSMENLNISQGVD